LSIVNKKVNRLSDEQSPYLKQHENNPVNWFPWGDDAFNLAKEEQKPIFLSIGYSTCHWCHVMEHESFSDPEVAALMNEVFISIKVDREERPDVDHIYMTVCQIMTGSGGWPLTILMTPEGKPFYAGTYFPKETRGNRTGIKDVIIRTKEVWEKFRNDISQQADEITHQLNSVNYKAGIDTINHGIFRKAFYELASNYDELNGGFGNKPKFPIPHNFMFLLRYGLRSNSPEAINMVSKTLLSMKRGGIWDHVGGGFHRYSTDSDWLVPHFEKMLYDEALLSIAFTETYQVTKDETFKQTSLEILNYICRDLRSEDGGFYSAEDADSEGEEGKFYLWSIKEIREILIGEVEFFCDVFNIKEKGNYFDEVKGSMTGLNILNRTKSYEQIAADYNISLEEAENKINNSLEKLYHKRNQRIRPLLDNKILADWNGLAIAALAKAARVFNDNSLKDYAAKSIEFFKMNLLNDDFTINHRFINGKSGITGMIDDYAYILFGLMEYYELTGDKEILNLSENINKVFSQLFSDNNGGFFFTAANAEKLISRKKEIYDGATPSGNSVMMDVLLRLYTFTGKQEYFDSADKIIKTFATAVTNVPSAYTYLLVAADRYLYGSVEVVILEGNNHQDSKELIEKLRLEFFPNLFVKLITNDTDLTNEPEYFRNMKNIDGKITAYICNNSECSEPITGIDQIIEKIKSKVIS